MKNHQQLRDDLYIVYDIYVSEIKGEPVSLLEAAQRINAMESYPTEHPRYVIAQRPL
jgi:hypothetical protein